MTEQVIPEKVWLSIKGTVAHDGEESDVMELLTEGIRSGKADSCSLAYDESEISGMEGTRTTVQVNGQKVSIIRLGSVNSLMEFESGKRSVTMYSTPEGDISMGITTRDIDIDYDESRRPSRVKVDYNIEMKGIGETDNTIDIQVKDLKN